MEALLITKSLIQWPLTLTKNQFHIKEHILSNKSKEFIKHQYLNSVQTTLGMAHLTKASV